MAFALFLQPEGWPDAREPSSHGNVPAWPSVRRQIYDEPMAAFARTIEDRPSSPPSFLDDVNVPGNIRGYCAHAWNGVDAAEILPFLFLAFEPTR